MKTLTLTLVTSLLLTGAALADDSTASVKAAPGTVQSTNSKTQMNNPAGPTDQNTAATPSDSKKVMNQPSGPSANGTDQSAPSATKTPQKDQQ